MLMIITTLILLILTAILLSGKGGVLIAGYNMLSQKEKEKHDGKKISRIMGVFLAYIVIGLSAEIFFGEYLIKYSGVVFVCALVLLAVCIFIACRIWKQTDSN